MVEIWAHRGSRVAAPENTMAAFRRAVTDGADGFELDVQLSKDGRLVVIHDETLDRTTNGHGLVKDHTFDELRALDASGGRGGFAGEQIPPLEEVLQLAASARLQVNVELKNSEVAYPGLEEKVLAAIDEAAMTERVVLSTFSQESVRRLTAMTAIQVGLLFDLNQLFIGPCRRAVALGATALHPPRRRTTRHLVERAHAAGLTVRVWTANDQRWVQRLVGYGVDGVFTDVPLVARAAAN